MGKREEQEREFKQMVSIFTGYQLGIVIAIILVMIVAGKIILPRLFVLS